MTEKKLEFSEDELVHPEYLNTEFFTNVMKEYKKDKDIKIVNVNITPGAMKGDHYASIIFRSVVDYKTGKGEEDTISLIVKCLPVQEGIKKDMIGETGIFSNEITLYTKVIADVEKRLQDVGIDFKVGAELIYHTLSPNEIIVFTDITKQGFQMKRDMITYKDAGPMITKLAQWHAATFLIVREHPEIIKSYRSGLFGANLTMDFFDVQMKAVVDTVTEWPDFEQYKSPLLDFYKNYKEQLMNIFGPVESNFNVMVHGDFHQRNLMHKIQDDKVVDTAMLDFQISFVGSPAIDIIYMIYCTLDADSIEKCRDEMIAEYHKHFKSTLTQLGFLGKCPSLLDLQVEILRCGPLEPFLVFEFMIFFEINDKEIDFNKLVDPKEGNELRKQVLNTPRLKDYLMKFIPRFVHKGFIA